MVSVAPLNSKGEYRPENNIGSELYFKVIRMAALVHLHSHVTQSCVHVDNSNSYLRYGTKQIIRTGYF